MKRIFFAVKIEPGKFLNEVVQTYKHSLADKKIKRVVPDKYHIKLSFLGNTAFSPHLTIGRLKKVKSQDILKSLLQKYEDTDIQKIPVNEVILHESITRPAGPVYNALRKFRVSQRSLFKN